MHSSFHKDGEVTIRGVTYKKHVILGDVNLPYKLSIDRKRNDVFFCINADQFSDQSFHSVRLCLDVEVTTIVPGIRNGFASAVDESTGIVYLGGSDGVFTYNHQTGDVDQPAIVRGIDIFDVYYRNKLYFVDTGTQTLRAYEYGATSTVPYVEGHLIHHFAVDSYNNIYFVNPNGLHIYRKGASSVQLLDDTEIQYRGLTFDTKGVLYFVARDGIYVLDEMTTRPVIVYPINNAFGLAFDKDNNLIYSDERSVYILVH